MTDPEHAATGPAGEPGSEPIGDKEFEVPDGSRDQRADKSLVAAFPGQSRAGLQRLLAEGLVRRNGVALSKSDRVRAGERITITFPPPTPSTLEPIDLNLEVLFDDREFLVINKPAGLTVHPGAGTRGDTLVHGLLALCRGELSGIGGVERPGIVHRLDRETSGVLLVAKTDAAHRRLTEQFAHRSLRKEYLTLIRGIPKTSNGRIDLAISRHPTERHRMTTGQQGRSRPSLTEWSIEKTFPGKFSLLRCRIHTGRTHQIRVHLSAIGHSILGDRVYGFRPRAEDPIGIPRVMLHAALLEFAHPTTGETLVVEAPLPPDFQAVLKALANPG